MGELVQAAPLAEIVEKVVIQGDLSRLSPAERVAYYKRVCESLGLNPLTKPFDYIVLNGRLTLYARKDATDQLRRIHGISIRIVNREMHESLGLYVVTARATTPDGREDEAIGAVSIKGLSGDALANAIMKAETKAKRRVTLSIVGLGWTDESEIETIPNAHPVRVDYETGEILDDDATERSATPKQVQKLAILLKEAGFGTSDEEKQNGRAFIAWLVGRGHLGSIKDLSRDEASRAIARLEREHVDELLAKWALERSSEVNSE